MSTPWPAYPPPPARAGAPRWAIALIALVTALLMVVGVVIVLTLTGGVASASEVTREPVRTAGANPFMPTVGEDSEVVAPAGTGGTYRGDTPGLYGGTRDNRTCDAAKLTGFLDSHPGQAAAWAGVLGIRTSEIDSYVSTLTPVLLRSDTWVTNHGYANGRATVVSSVLQAGTAVFVDRYGSPVVRCYCGNPLTAPTLVTSPVYTGPTWVSFDQTNITVVQNTTTVVNDYTIVDPWRNAPFVREGGYAPGWQPKRDQDWTGGPLPGLSPNGSAPGTSAGSGTSSASAPPEAAATCPDGTEASPSDVTTTTGDLTRDGRADSVRLVECGDEQTVDVVDASGTPLGTLSSQIPEGSPLPARFDPSTFSLSGTTLTTAMDVFAADDTEADGPSLRQTWTWNWDGQAFTLSPGSMTAVPAAPTTTDTAPSADPALVAPSFPVAPPQYPQYPTDTTTSSPSSSANAGG